MAKEYPPDEMAFRLFAISVVGILAWVGAAFYFVILKQ
jgi:uncharacterized membrane protein